MDLLVDLFVLFSHHAPNSNVGLAQDGEMANTTDVIAKNKHLNSSFGLTHSSPDHPKLYVRFQL
jgi:hypothetical protein